MADDSPHLPYLPVQQRPAKSLAARREGILAVDEATNCIVLFLVDTSMIEVAWPPGCSVGLRDGVPAVLDPDGATIGRLGDNVVLGGGHMSPEAAHTTSRTGSARVFAVAGRYGLPS